MNTDVRTLLLVDSDPAEGPELAARLRDAGYDVDLVMDLKRAIEQATSVPYAIVVTELDLPGSGTELIRRVRELGETAPPVLVLSRRTEEIDRVVAFEVGAADYLPRPYYFRELLLRLRARERRTRSAPAVVDYGALSVQPVEGRATVAGEPLELTPTERELLAAILSRAGTVVTRATLLREIWGLERGGSRTLDTHLRRLRRKLGAHGALLETVRGVGVRVSLDAAGKAGALSRGREPRSHGG